MSLKIEVTHSETHSKTFITELETDERKIQKVDLEYKPTYLEVFVSTKGAEIFLDDEQVSREEIKRKRIVANREYSLIVKKEGYRPYEKTVSLKGGEKKTLQ